MARTANSEQKLAIEHQGGVLLSAGAGSGKTFVLVEHIIYLISNFHQQHAALSVDELERSLKQYLSQIVLMTFTKKAAGELSLRLKKRLEEQARDFDQVIIWKLAKDALNSMTVSTIHGLCHQLLTSGEIPNFDPEIEISSEIDLYHKMELLFEKWYALQTEEVQKQTAVRTMVANRTSLLDSLVGIFSAPELRLMWKKLHAGHLLGSNLPQLLRDTYKLLEVEGILQFGCAIPDNSVKAKWPEFLREFNQLCSSFPAFEVDNLKKYDEFFQNYKGIRAPTKSSGFDQVIEEMGKLKIFREFLGDHLESYLQYAEHVELAVKNWGESFKKIVDFVEEHYRTIPGLNFSDLEYYLMLALDDPKIADRLSKSYKYFIVDEFQDTSFIQFDILKKLIQGDFSKLFCVGDKKQAIYGFRGGEIGVFDQCSDNIPLNLSMSNNYRSTERIIDFNNSLFHYLFSRGIGFEGLDPFAVEVVPQAYPFKDESNDIGGRICSTTALLELEEGTRMNTAQAALLEANIFLEKLFPLLQDEKIKSVAFLYSKLGPSRYLIAKLIQSGIGFTAQIKVPLSDDPVLGVFKLLLQIFLVKRDTPEVDYWNYGSLLFDGYFHFLQMSVPTSLRDAVEQWLAQIPLYGIAQATENFFYRIGWHNSNYNNNYQLISDLCLLSKGNIDQCFNLLESHSDGTYSIEFQRGHQAGQVQIMTVHASKGLEFDSVFLGGINTNGLSRPFTGYFGKNPGSFKWKLKPEQKSPFLSPEYIFENLLNKRKEFAESKRLFYVACTRAIKELYWVDLESSKGAFSSGDNSWIDGLRAWKMDQAGTPLAIHCAAEAGQYAVTSKELDQQLEEISTKAPLFHLDNLGLKQRGDEGVLGLLSELSVTRLSLLADCPKRFYLKNICRLEEDDLETLSAEEANKEWREEKLLVGNDELQTCQNRMNRGTAIHAAIEASLTNKEYDKQYERQVRFVHEQVDRLPTNRPDYILEIPIKFPLFGQTINGIPDFLLLGDQPQIWDFKSGKRKEDKEQGYWFQLRCYAYSLYLQNRIPLGQSTKMVLLYVDHQERIEIEETLEQLTHSLFPIWQRLAHLEERSDNCEFCPYRGICTNS